MPRSRTAGAVRGRAEGHPRDNGCPGGCKLALKCPFPVCRMEIGYSVRMRALPSERDQNIVLAYYRYSAPAEVLAEAAGISPRSINRVIAKARET